VDDALRGSVPPLKDRLILPGIPREPGVRYPVLPPVSVAPDHVEAAVAAARHDVRAVGIVPARGGACELAADHQEHQRPHDDRQPSYGRIGRPEQASELPVADTDA
jgi:hypothetical protein